MNRLEIALPKEKLYTYCICDLLDGLNIVTGDELVICVKEFDTRLFKCTLSQ